jgi:hypothetical protein
MKGLKLGLMCAAVLFTATIHTGALAQDAGAAPPQAPGGGRGFGQRGFGGFGRFGGPLSLATLPLPYITSALELTDDQKTKIQAVQEKARSDMQAARPAPGEQPDFNAMREKMTAINTQAKTDIEAVLTDAQKKKVEGMLKDAGTYQGVNIPLEVVPDLKVTAEQKTKLAEIAATAAKERQATMKDMQDAQQSGDQQKLQEIRQSMMASFQATQEKAQAVLTDTQKAAIKKYQDEHPRPNRRGGPGGAGNA